MIRKKPVCEIAIFLAFIVNISCASGSNIKDKYYLLQSNLKGHKLSVSSFSFDNVGGKLFSAGIDGRISIFDLKNTNNLGKIFSWQDRPEVIGSQGRGGAIITMALSPDSRYLYTAGVHSEKSDSKKGRMKIIDIKNGGKVKEFLDELSENIITSLRVSKSGKYLLASTETGQFALWEGKDDKFTIVHLSPDFERQLGTSFIDIRNDEKYFIEYRNFDLYIWSIAQDSSVKFVNRVYIENSEFFTDGFFSPDGKSIIILNRSLNSSKVLSYDFDQILAAPMDKKLKGKTLAQLPKLTRLTPHNARNEFIALTKSGNSIQALAISYSTGQSRNVTPVNFSWAKSNNKNTAFPIVIAASNGKLSVGDRAGNVYIIDTDTRRMLGMNSSEIQLIEESNIESNSLLVKGAPFGDTRGLQMQLNMLKLVVAKDELNKLSSSTKNSSEKKKKCHSILEKYGELTLIDGYTLTHHLSDGQCLVGHDKNLWILIGSDRVCLLNFESGDLKCTLSGIIGMESVNLSSDRKFLTVVNKPGNEVMLFETENLITIATFTFSLDKKNWLAYTPDSYVMGTSEGFSWYGWKEQSEKDEKHIKFYGFDLFDLKFNRPDIILRRLWGDGISLTEDQKSQITKLRKFAEIRAKQNGFSLEKLEANKTIHAPEVSFSENFDGKVMSQELLKLNISAVDETTSIIGYKVWANGVPIYGEYIRRVYPGTNSLIDDNKVSFTEPITLSHGENKIEVSAFTEDGVESPRESFTVTYNPPAKRKPDLYFVGIGIDEYNPGVSGGLDALKYAVKDSKELEDVFKKSGTGKFGKVMTKVITNKEVNRDSMKSLREFLKQSKVNDHVILFLSGHGIRKDTKVGDLISAFGENVPPQYKLRDKGDMDDVYYYMTSDANVEKPWEKAIPLDAIREIVNGIPSRQKIMLVDTCQSGEKFDLDDATIASLSKNVEIRKTRGKTAATRGVKLVTTGNAQQKPEDVEKKIVQTIVKSNLQKQMSELFPELRRGTGTIEISAATGAQSALESSEWKNGAFTFVIKQAILKGKAKDKNGNITARSLRQYVLDEVEKLTDGQQTPMVARDIAGRDFVIFGK